MSSPLTGNRSTRLTVELLSNTGASKGFLDGVTGGSVDYSAATSVKSRANLALVDNGQAINFLTDRVRPAIVIDGVGTFPLGVFVFSGAPEAWANTGRSWAATLLDKLSILDQDAVDTTYALDAGTVITTAVAALIATTGETNVAITPSTATLANPLAWDPGTSKLAIINDLLDAAGYFSLFCDQNGAYRGEPYVRPAARPIVFEFLDGDTCVYLAEFTRDVDLFAIPNKVIAVGQGSADTPALVATATNANPASPYSTASRGRTITQVYTGVEAADQDTLDAYALRRLIDATSPTSSVEIQHAFIPGLTFNQAVRFRRDPAAIDGRHVVSKTTVNLDPTMLVKTTLTEVVDL